MLVTELGSIVEEVTDDGIAVVVSEVEGGDVEPPKTHTSPGPRGIWSNELDRSAPSRH